MLLKLFRQVLGVLGLVKECLDNSGRLQQCWTSYTKVVMLCVVICKNYELATAAAASERPYVVRRRLVVLAKNTACLSPLKNWVWTIKRLILEVEARQASVSPALKNKSYLQIYGVF